MLPRSSPPITTAADPPLVAAAADLKFALTDLVAEYRNATGREVKVDAAGQFRFEEETRDRPFPVFIPNPGQYLKDGAVLDVGCFTGGRGVSSSMRSRVVPVCCAISRTQPAYATRCRTSIS